MNNDNHQHFEEIEEKLRRENEKHKLEKHEEKVSGKSVFNIQKIIKDKNNYSEQSKADNCKLKAE